MAGLSMSGVAVYRSSPRNRGVPDMFDQSKLDVMLGVDEGDVSTVYTDTRGHPTIGKGHNLDASPLPAGWAPPLTEDQINQLLDMDTSKTLANLDARWPGWRDLPEPVTRVIAGMGFNMGVGQWGVSGLMQFTGFIGLIKAGQYSAAADDLTHTLWQSQVGARALRYEALLRTAG